MADIKLAQPILRVTMEDPDSGEWTEFVVQTTNRDAIKFDILRASRKWPVVSDAPILWMTVCAWSALQHDGTFKGKLDEFMEQCVSLKAVDRDGKDIVDAADAAEVDVDPTDAIAATDS